jgi:hypothetical protein
VLPVPALNATVTVGVFLLMLSLIGCFGVRFNYKVGGRYALGFYAFFMVIVMLMELIAALSIFTWVGLLDDYSAAQQYKAHGLWLFINSTYSGCCCAIGTTVMQDGSKVVSMGRCVFNNTCILPSSQPYPCDSKDNFAEYFTEYLTGNIEPVAGVTLFLFFLQFFTSVSACCNQCQGRKQEEKNKIGGALSYDGLYSEGDEAYSGYGYESYVKSGAAAGAPAPPRPGSAAAHAAAAAAGHAAPPRGPPRAAPAPAPPAVPPRAGPPRRQQ